MASQDPLFEETLAPTVDRVTMCRYGCLCLSFPTYKEMLPQSRVLKVIRACSMLAKPCCHV